MATAKGNTVAYGNYYFVNWQLSTQEVDNNRSRVNWQAKWRFNNSDAQLDNGNVVINGSSRWDNGGRVYNYSGNISTRDLQVASGSHWINHNSDGTKTFNINGSLSQYGSGTSSVNSNFSLPTIPRNSQVSTNKTSYTLGEAITIYTNRKSSSFTHRIRIRLNNSGGTLLKEINSVGASTTWTPNSTEINTMLSSIPNSNSLNLYIESYNHQVGASSSVSRTQNVTNADPIFTDFSYRDVNSSTVAITGDDQYIIQGYGEVEVAISSDQSATAQKSASMVKYNMALAGVSVDQSYTTSPIAKNIGVTGANSNSSLVVKAIDSRNNSTSVSKTVLILPYVAPQVTAIADRLNNFESLTTIHIEGVVSRLTIAGTDKNAVNSTNGVQYRYKKVGASTWGAWTNRASTLSSGNVSTTDFDLTLDRNFAWDMEVKLTDKLQTTTIAIVIPVGIPIFRISTYDNKVYSNEQPLMPSHVGQIIITTTLATPEEVADIYGGTWVAWGLGRAIVGMGNNGETNYTTVEQEFGSDNITLTTSQLPKSTAPLRRDNANGNPFGIAGSGGDANGYAVSTGSLVKVYSNSVVGVFGDSQPHPNVQRSKSAYIYKRTV